MPNSVIEAIQQGIWNFEPKERSRAHFDGTAALPGTEEKLMIMAERLEKGQPLWHPEDRLSFRDEEE